MSYCLNVLCILAVHNFTVLSIFSVTKKHTHQNVLSLPVTKKSNTNAHVILLPKIIKRHGRLPTANIHMFHTTVFLCQIYTSKCIFSKYDLSKKVKTFFILQ